MSNQDTFVCTINQTEYPSVLIGTPYARFNGVPSAFEIDKADIPKLIETLQAASKFSDKIPLNDVKET